MLSAMELMRLHPAAHYGSGSPFPSPDDGYIIGGWRFVEGVVVR
jgi:hypothetical protein